MKFINLKQRELKYCAALDWDPLMEHLEKKYGILYKNEFKKKISKCNSSRRKRKEKKEMKITRILPKFLAKTYQEEDLRKAEIHLEYHRDLVRNLEFRVAEGRAELQRLRDAKND